MRLILFLVLFMGFSQYSYAENYCGGTISQKVTKDIVEIKSKGCVDLFLTKEEMTVAVASNGGNKETALLSVKNTLATYMDRPIEHIDFDFNTITGEFEKLKVGVSIEEV